MQSFVNVSGRVLLKAIRDGKMDSNLEDAQEHFKLSSVGFEMKNSKGSETHKRETIQQFVLYCIFLELSNHFYFLNRFICIIVIVIVIIYYHYQII